MKASILTIGDEILIGQIVDTNSASIARHLNNAGIVVWERTSVGDQREQITEAVKRAMNQSDVVILTALWGIPTSSASPGGSAPPRTTSRKRPSPSSSAPGSYAIKPSPTTCGACSKRAESNTTA